MKITFTKIALLFLIVATTAMTMSSCRQRDCKGRKKTAKTAMGGWL